MLGSRVSQQMKRIIVLYDNIDTTTGKHYTHDTVVCQVEKAQSGDVIMQQVYDVFSGLGSMKGKIHLHTDPDIKPVIIPPRRVPEAIKPKLKTALNKSA